MRWAVAGRMATAWVFTLPSAGLVGAGSYGLARVVGGTLGVVLDAAVLAAIAAGIYLRSRTNQVGSDNVKDEWTGTTAPTARRIPVSA